MKRKRQTTDERECVKVNENAVLMADSEVEDDLLDSHYTKPHWVCETTETLVVGNRGGLVSGRYYVV